MKRSDILKLIESHYDCFTSGCSSSEESEDHASQMLSKLEELGMLPPILPNEKDSWPDSRAYQWEPEDET